LLARRGIVEEVQTALPHRHDTRFVKQGGQPPFVALAPRARLVGMDSEGAPYVPMSTAKLEQSLSVLQPDRRNEKPAHTDRSRLIEKALDLGSLEVLEMTV
jgi:hypothetical protein